MFVLLAVAMFTLATPWGRAQTSVRPGVSPSGIAVVKSFRIMQEKDGPAVEILSTKPLVPSIQAIDHPPRLVIDLPNARLDTTQKRIRVHADQIVTLRGDQFQAKPPVARIVLDLEAQRSYTWDSLGNRLVVHLGKNPSGVSLSPFQAPSVPGLSLSAPPPVVSSVRTSSPLAVAQSSLAPGAAFTAAEDTAILALARGGEVYVCPGTSVSVTSSQNGHNVMLGMSTGAMEAHFTLDASSDSVMTPDFRMLMTGPGEFHYAFSADRQGNTCVRALPGNTASVIVSELLGDHTYQVKATDQVLFRFGQVDQVDTSVPIECGCPPPRLPALRALNNVPVTSAAPTANPISANASAAQIVATARGENEALSAPAADPPTNHATPELHVQVEAPLVFHANGPPPVPMEDVRALPLDSRRLSVSALTAPLPPPAQEDQRSTGTETARVNPAPSHGFFHKLGRFFAAMFR